MTGLLVHEWIEPRGGAERVLDAFAAAHPDADLFCLWDDAPGRYDADRVIESGLARSPLRGRKAASMPFMPAVWRRAGRKGTRYDWMLVSSHLFAHQARARGVAPERTYVYAHTPARYLWAPELDLRGGAPAVRAVAPAFRAADARSARSLRNVAVNSRFVQERVRRAWGIESVVIHPPVEVDALVDGGDWSARLDAHDAGILAALPETFVLGASRFVPYKRLDLVIAAGAAAGVPVVLAGGGPAEADLRALAVESDVDVRFVIRPGDALLAALMQRALVFVFPAVEDFGIMPVEALALGTPVVVGSEGGATESVDESVGAVARAADGHAPDARSIGAAVVRAADVDPALCRARAERFSRARFDARIAAWTGPLPASA